MGKLPTTKLKKKPRRKKERPRRKKQPGGRPVNKITKALRAAVRYKSFESIVH
jgi:hypothetical protein